MPKNPVCLSTLGEHSIRLYAPGPFLDGRSRESRTAIGICGPQGPCLKCQVCGGLFMWLTPDHLEGKAKSQFVSPLAGELGL
jgi:hypothetical protein